MEDNRANKDVLTPSQLVGLGKIESAPLNNSCFSLSACLTPWKAPLPAQICVCFASGRCPLSERMLHLLDTEATFQQGVTSILVLMGREQLATVQIITISSAIVAIMAGLLLALAIASSIVLWNSTATDAAQQIQAGDLEARGGSHYRR